MVNGATSGANAHRENRSVSDRMHDRAGRQSSSTAAGPASNGRPSTGADGHRSHHHSEKGARRGEHRGSNAGAVGGMLAAAGGGQSNNQSGARESFLNYFFGGQDADVDASAVLRSEVDSRHRASPGSHDYLPDLSKGEGRLSGRRGVEGSGAAFDMKSLGKHLEAVSPCFSLFVARTKQPLTLVAMRKATVARGPVPASALGPRRDGDHPHSIPHLVLLLYRPPDHSRPRPEGRHARASLPASHSLLLTLYSPYCCSSSSTSLGRTSSRGSSPACTSPTSSLSFW